MAAFPVERPAIAARSTVFALVATAVDKGGGMLVLLLIARLLGTEDFGRYAALMSLLAFVQIAAELGQEPVLVRLLAQARGEGTRDLLEGALAMRLALALAAGAALVMGGHLVLPAVGPGLLALAAVGLLASFGVALRAFFRATQRLEWLCVTAAIRIGAFAAVLAAGHAAGLGLAAAVGGWAAGQLATTIASMGLAARGGVPRVRWHAAVARRLASSGWALALNAFLLTVTLRVGHLIVLHLEGPAAVGFLAAGAQLAEAFALLPEAVMLALLPVLSAYDLEARGIQRALSVRLVRVLGLLALAVIIVVSVMAPVLLASLYGAAFAEGAAALRVLAWLALLAASGTVLTNLLIARGLERVLLAVNVAGSALTLGLSLLVVPRFGFEGAALATLSASAVAQALLLALPSTRADAAACLRPLIWPLVAAGALVAVAVRLGDPGATTALASLAAFGGLMLATGAVGRDDWALVRRALGRHRGGDASDAG